jgi:hypothetical protein
MARLRRLLLMLTWVAGLSLPVVVFGCGRGKESQFSPDSFELRDVTCYSLPFVDWPFLSVSSTPYRHKLVQFWIDEGYLDGKLREPTRWDHASRLWSWSESTSKGRAGWFGDLAWENGWINWSRKNPRLAARLWPDIVRLLPHVSSDPDACLCALDLMWVANTTDAEDFDETYALQRRDWAALLERLTARAP